MTEYHYNNRRQLVDKDGNPVNHNVMRDGEAISVSVMFTDSAAPFTDANDDGQSAYEARIANAWKDTAATSPAHVADDGQELYEARMNDAWKARPEDYPEAA